MFLPFILFSSDPSFRVRYLQTRLELHPYAHGYINLCLETSFLSLIFAISVLVCQVYLPQLEHI
jgi:hypothetical protein